MADDGLALFAVRDVKDVPVPAGVTGVEVAVSAVKRNIRAQDFLANGVQRRVLDEPGEDRAGVEEGIRVDGPVRAVMVYVGPARPNRVEFLADPIDIASKQARQVQVAERIEELAPSGQSALPHRSVARP